MIVTSYYTSYSCRKYGSRNSQYPGKVVVIRLIIVVPVHHLEFANPGELEGSRPAAVGTSKLHCLDFHCLDFHRLGQVHIQSTSARAAGAYLRYHA